MFLTSGTWGMWHDDVLKETLSTIPIRFPQNPEIAQSIERCVDALRELPEAKDAESLFGGNGMSAAQRLARIQELEAELDQSVFDLFDFSEQEKDRVTELCDFGLDLLYQGMKSEAVKPLSWPEGLPRFGTKDDLVDKGEDCFELMRYLSTYLNLWDPYLKEQRGKLRWRIVQPSGDSPMMAAIFQTESNKSPLPPPSDSEEDAWHSALAKIQQNALQAKGTQRVFIDGMIRVVTETDIVIIKRNERRLWTASTARDDAEASMLLTMQLGEVLARGKR